MNMYDLLEYIESFIDLYEIICTYICIDRCGLKYLSKENIFSLPKRSMRDEIK